MEVVTKALRGVEHKLPGAVEEVWHLVYRWVVRRGELLLARDALRFSITADDLAHEAFLKIRSPTWRAAGIGGICFASWRGRCARSSGISRGAEGTLRAWLSTWTP